jgi:hypothetical protein
MTTCDETATTETEKDQENTPENVSECVILWTANIPNIRHMLQGVINNDQQ